VAATSDISRRCLHSHKTISLRCVMLAIQTRVNATNWIEMNVSHFNRFQIHKKPFCIAVKNHSVLCREIIAVLRSKHSTYGYCGQNVECLDVKLGVTECDHEALNIKIHIANLRMSGRRPVYLYIYLPQMDI